MADTESKRSRPSAQPRRRLPIAKGNKRDSHPVKASPGNAKAQTDPELYRTLASMNESLKIVSEGLGVLQAAKLLSPRSAKLRRATAEELRASINATATINVHQREMDAAFHFQQERFRFEEKNH